MNNKEIFDKLEGWGFEYRSDILYYSFKAFAAVAVTGRELAANRSPKQLKKLLISRVRNAKETAIAECDEIEKTIREVFDEQ